MNLSIKAYQARPWKHRSHQSFYQKRHYFPKGTPASTQNEKLNLIVVVKKDIQEGFVHQFEKQLRSNFKNNNLINKQMQLDMIHNLKHNFQKSIKQNQLSQFEKEEQLNFICFQELVKDPKEMRKQQLKLMEEQINELGVQVQDKFPQIQQNNEQIKDKSEEYSRNLNQKNDLFRSIDETIQTLKQNQRDYIKSFESQSKEQYFQQTKSREFFHSIKLNSILNIIKLLKYHKNLVNDKDEFQMTGLHWASKRGYLNIAQILLDYDADLDQKDHFQRTPIQLAKQYKQQVLLDLFKQVKKGLYIRDKSKYNNPIYIKSLLPDDLIEEFNKYLGLSTSSQNQFDFLYE